MDFFSVKCVNFSSRHRRGPFLFRQNFWLEIPETFRVNWKGFPGTEPRLHLILIHSLTVFFLVGGGGFLFWLMCHNEILAFVFATRNEKYYVKSLLALLHRTCMRRCYFERKDQATIFFFLDSYPSSGDILFCEHDRLKFLPNEE